MPSSSALSGTAAAACRPFARFAVAALASLLIAPAAAADPPVRDYTAQLVRGVVAHASEIDARISACLAPGWSLPRIPRVDRNVLRIAVFEIDYGEVPDAVAVSEAVQLVSELSTEDSPAFVNGVLRAVATSGVG